MRGFGPLRFSDHFSDILLPHSWCARPKRRDYPTTSFPRSLYTTPLENYHRLQAVRRNGRGQLVFTGSLLGIGDYPYSALDYLKKRGAGLDIAASHPLRESDFRSICLPASIRFRSWRDWIFLFCCWSRLPGISSFGENPCYIRSYTFVFSPPLLQLIVLGGPQFRRTRFPAVL